MKIPAVTTVDGFWWVDYGWYRSRCCYGSWQSSWYLSSF